MDLGLALIIGIIMFFFLRWISKKYIRQERNQILFLIVGVPVTTVLVYVACGYLALFLILYSPEKDFDSKSWMTDKNDRYQMVGDLIDRKILINADSNKVKQLIGEPASRDSTNTYWGYDLGMGGGGLGFLLHYLDIKYENNKVVDVQHIEVKD